MEEFTDYSDFIISRGGYSAVLHDAGFVGDEKHTIDLSEHVPKGTKGVFLESYHVVNSGDGNVYITFNAGEGGVSEVEFPIDDYIYDYETTYFITDMVFVRLDEERKFTLQNRRSTSTDCNIYLQVRSAWIGSVGSFNPNILLGTVKKTDRYLWWTGTPSINTEVEINLDDHIPTNAKGVILEVALNESAAGSPYVDFYDKSGAESNWSWRLYHYGGGKRSRMVFCPTRNGKFYFMQKGSGTMSMLVTGVGYF